MLNITARLLRIEPARLARIVTIGFPIIGGMLSQSLINLIDAAMVGRLGEVSLAAVGIGGYATFVTVSVVMGLAAGVQAIVARRHGAQQHHALSEPLVAGLVISLFISLPLTVLFLLVAPQYIGIFNNDASVLAIAVPYFEWRTLALLFVGMNFVFRGYWSGIGSTRIYLWVLLWMHLANVVISYFLIFGFASWQGYGAVGSGMGTAAALALGCLAYWWLTFYHRQHRVSHWQWPTRSTLNTVARLAIPNSIQQTLFALGVSVLFWIIGQVGTQEQAIGHILISLALLLILPAVGLGIASTSLVSHALGANNPDDAYRWGWEVVRVAVFIMALIGLPLWLFPGQILALFTNETHLIELGIWPLRISGLNIAFEVTAMVLTQALLGAGASRQVMRINLIMQWGVLLPLAYWIGPIAGYGLLGIWLLQGLQRITLSAIYASLWRSRRWANIRL